jgi:hypothetical protein
MDLFFSLPLPRPLGCKQTLHLGCEVCQIKVFGYFSVKTRSKPWVNKTEKSFSNIAASQFCYSRYNKSTTTLQFWFLRGCVIVVLQGCVIVAWLLRCEVAWLLCCVIVALQSCVIVALQGCMIVALQGCVIVALQGCVTILRIVVLQGCVEGCMIVVLQGCVIVLLRVCCVTRLRDCAFLLDWWIYILIWLCRNPVYFTPPPSLLDQTPPNLVCRLDLRFLMPLGNF